MKKRFLLTAVFLGFILTACSNSTLSEQKPSEGEDFLMGTTIVQKVYGKDAAAAVSETSARMKQIESLMTINAAGGEINKLNDAAGKNKVKLSDETLKILETAKHYSELSGGAFDVTVGPLVKAWGIFTDHPRIPGKEELDRLLTLVDYRTLLMDRANSEAMLEKQGQMVDLGGIAKGYAGDEAIKIYKKYNIKSAYINLGGNVVVLGSKPDGSPWRIGIQNPRASNGMYVGILSATDKAVVTSGDYERYFMKDNNRYHHILDTKTGSPADSGLISATIVTGVSMDADALSTAVFVLGLEKGRKLIESLPDTEAIFITADKKIYVTEGLKTSFTFEDESKEFKYVEEG